MTDDDSSDGVVTPITTVQIRGPKGKFLPRKVGIKKKPVADTPPTPVPEPELAPPPAPNYIQPVPAPSPPPPEPTPEPEPLPVSKTFRCNNSYCGLTYATEKELADHQFNAHKGKRYQGGGKMPEGARIDPIQPITLPGGFMGDARDITAQVDIYAQFRNMLDSFQIRDNREAIVDSFASTDEPGNVKRLKALLIAFGVQPSRVNLIVDRWARYIEDVGMAVEDVDEDTRQKERKGNPLKANFDDMANWGPGEWAQYQMQMQKNAMAMKMNMMMMKNMMKSMDMNEGEMNAMGMGIPGGQGQSQIPREIQVKLDRLAQFEERDKLKEAIDPVMRALNGLRADFEDQKAAPKKDSMTDLMDMVKMQQLLKAMGPQHEKDADVMRVQMEERIENKKMQMEKEYRELQAKMEQAKESNHQLEMKNIQTAMEAKIDNLKTLNEIASRDKGQDLETVINNALRVKDTLAKLQGDNETDDDKKMKNIMGAIQGTIETVAPSIDKIASGFLMSQQAKAAGARGPSGPPPGVANIPAGMQGQRPPRGPTNRKIATCTKEGCGRDFEVDPTRPTAQCPGCLTVYDVGDSPRGSQGPPPSQYGSGPMGDMGAKRSTLLRMDRPTLEEAARGQGIDPDQYPTHEMLVDVMMGNTYQ